MGFMWNSFDIPGRKPSAAEQEQLRKHVKSQLSEQMVELPWWITGSVELKGPLYNAPIMMAPGSIPPSQMLPFMIQGPNVNQAGRLPARAGRRGAIVRASGNAFIPPSHRPAAASSSSTGGGGATAGGGTAAAAAAAPPQLPPAPTASSSRTRGSSRGSTLRRTAEVLFIEDSDDNLLNDDDDDLEGVYLDDDDGDY